MPTIVERLKKALGNKLPNLDKPQLLQALESHASSSKVMHLNITATANVVDIACT